MAVSHSQVAQSFCPIGIASGQAIIVEGSQILGIIAAGEVSTLSEITEIVDVGGRYIAPGLIDIHTHGAYGRTFNEPTVEAFATITAANAAHGVTALLATIATDALPNLTASLAFCAAWMRQPHPGAQLLGAHLEGPYFSMDQRGAQIRPTSVAPTTALLSCCWRIMPS